MSSPATTASPTHREPDLLGQTVIAIGGSAGIRRHAVVGIAARRSARKPSQPAPRHASHPARRRAGRRRRTRHARRDNTALTGATYDVDGGQQLI
jgi:hypothetical protein